MSESVGNPVRQDRWRRLREVAVDLALIAGAVALVYSVFFQPPAIPAQARTAPSARRPEPPLPAEPVSLEGATLHGSPTAGVALIEYSDFECPFCGKFARETLPALEEKYIKTGRLLMAFRHYPLPIHAMAQKAAEAAECAGQEEKFWAMHGRLFQEPRRLAVADLRQHARLLGLNEKQFDACLNGKMTAKVRADAERARTLGITGTPTFFVGRIEADGRVRVAERLPGAQATATFEAAIERVLSLSRAVPSKADEGKGR